MCPDRSMVTGTEQKTSLKQVLVLEFESEFKSLFQGFFSVETVVFWIWASCLQHWALRLIHFRLIKFCSSCSLPACCTLGYVGAAEAARDQANWLWDIERQLLRKRKPGIAFSVKKSQEDSKGIWGSQEKHPQMGTLPSLRGWLILYTYPATLLLGAENRAFWKCATLRSWIHNGTFHLFLVTFIFFCCWIPYIIVSISQASTMVSSG